MSKRKAATVPRRGRQRLTDQTNIPSIPTDPFDLNAIAREAFPRRTDLFQDRSYGGYRKKRPNSAFSDRKVTRGSGRKTGGPGAKNA